MMLDFYWRRVVGWSMETSPWTELILAALNTASTQRPPSTVIHHSDRGCEYTSCAFGKRCREAGVMLAMGSVGDVYNNAMAEVFFATGNQDDKPSTETGQVHPEYSRFGICPVCLWKITEQMLK